MAKVGRPKWVPTPEILQTIETNAALGMKKERIAYLVGLQPPTYSTKQSEFPELNEAFMRGRAKGVGVASKKLFELIQDKHYPAIQFFLKSQDGWRENEPVIQSMGQLVIKMPDGKEYKMGEGINE